MKSLKELNTTSTNINATYIGHDPRLIGHTALLVYCADDSKVAVQFDRHDAPDNMAFGWHEFPVTDWVVRPPIDWSEMDEPRRQT